MQRRLGKDPEGGSWGPLTVNPRVTKYGGRVRSDSLPWSLLWEGAARKGVARNASDREEGHELKRPGREDARLPSAGAP